MAFPARIVELLAGTEREGSLGGEAATTDGIGRTAANEQITENTAAIASVCFVERNTRGGTTFAVGHHWAGGACGRGHNRVDRRRQRCWGHRGDRGWLDRLRGELLRGSEADGTKQAGNGQDETTTHGNSFRGGFGRQFQFGNLLFDILPEPMRPNWLHPFAVGSVSRRLARRCGRTRFGLSVAIPQSNLLGQTGAVVVMVWPNDLPDVLAEIRLDRLGEIPGTVSERG